MGVMTSLRGFTGLIPAGQSGGRERDALHVEARGRQWVVDQHLPIVEREIFIDNLLVRIHFITEMILWTGLAPCVPG